MTNERGGFVLIEPRMVMKKRFHLVLLALAFVVLAPTLLATDSGPPPGKRRTHSLP